MLEKFNVTEHVFVPEHKKLTQKEKEEILKQYGITVKQLPKILTADPALANLDVKQGDVIKISRPSPTAGETEYFRGVVNE